MTTERSDAEPGYGAVTLPAAALAAMLPLLVLGLAVLWYGQPPAVEKSELRVELESRLAERAPSIVVLGNSLAAEAVDPPTLGTLLAEGLDEPQALPITVLDVSGSTPATWYAVLENVVYGSEAKPDLVVVAGSLGYLLGTAVTSEKQLAKLAQVSDEVEPVISRITYGKESSGLLWQRLTRSRGTMQESLLTAVREVSAGLVFSSPDPEGGSVRARGQAVADPALAAVFEGEGAVDLELNRRVVPVVEIDRDAAESTDRPVEDTYVPAILDLAAQHGSRVVFVRVPLPASNVAGRASGLDHLPEMVETLNARGAGWVDLSALDLPASAFWDRFHLTNAGSKVFSQALAAELLRIGALRTDGEILPATPPLVPARVEHIGTPPAYPLPAPTKEEAPCAWSFATGQLRGLSAVNLRRQRLWAAAPLVLLEDGRPLEPVAAGRGLGDTCAGQYRHALRSIVFAPSDDAGVAAHTYSLQVREDLVPSDDKGRTVYWIPPGTTLVMGFDAPWDARRGEFAVDLLIDAFPLSRESALPAVEVAGRAQSVSVDGPQNSISASGPAPEGPWEVRITAPAEGPWFRLRTMHAGGGSEGSWVVGDAADEAGSVAHLLLPPATVVYAADPQPLRGKSRPSATTDGIGRLEHEQIRKLSNAAVRKQTQRNRCSPVVVLEDGTPLGRSNARCAEVTKDHPGTACQKGRQVLFTSSDGSDVDHNGRRYTLGLDPSRFCGRAWWLYPGDALLAQGKPADLKAFGLGARSLQLSGVAIEGTGPDAEIAVRLRSGDDTVIDARVPTSALDGRGLVFDIDPPLPPGHADVSLEIDSPADAPFVMLTQAALGEAMAGDPEVGLDDLSAEDLEDGDDEDGDDGDGDDGDPG